MSSSLSHAAEERKLRLAQLRNLKRKQPPHGTEQEDDESTADKGPSPARKDGEDEDVAKKYLSGRNYDFETKTVKLGFDTLPEERLSTSTSSPSRTATVPVSETAEAQAARIESQARQEQAKREEAAAAAAHSVDLFTLQPKKPNWDLKRDLDRRLAVLNVKTENAIARIVRQRIEEEQKRRQPAAASTTTTTAPPSNAPDEGVDGTTLVEGIHVLEQEQEEERRREAALEGVI